MGNFLISTLLSISLFLTPVFTYIQPVPTKVELASHAISLEDRQPDPWVNEVFKDNILLNLAYLRGSVSKPSGIDWDQIRRPFTFELILYPGETFAFHDDVLSEFKDKIAKTTNAHFNYQDGFKSDGYLFGDGVCHLASLLYWVAKDAGLKVLAPVNHDFAAIADISPLYGVSIFNRGGEASGAMQNLYITNTKGHAVSFQFEYKNNMLRISVLQPQSSSIN